MNSKKRNVVWLTSLTLVWVAFTISPRLRISPVSWCGTAEAATEENQPPGLEKQDKMPNGLAKHGKTPRGWSKGKAWWKRSDQTPPSHGAASEGNRGVISSGGAAHSHPGHGHK